MKNILIIFTVLIHVCICATGSIPWYIIQISDPQLGFIEKNKSMKQEVILLKEAIRKINLIKPEIVIITGDFINSSRNKEQLTTFKELCNSISSDIRVYKVPGNHDIGKSKIKENLDYYKKNYNTDHFSICHKGVQLTGINSCLIKEDAPQKAEQYNWLNKTLKDNKNIKQRIVFGHHPFFLSDIREDENYSNQPIAERYKYDTLFSKQHVSYYFAGHLHNNAETEHKNCQYITTSAVGKQLGNASSGLRIIRIEGEQINHLYLPLEEIPESAYELNKLFTSETKLFNSYKGLVMCGYQGWFNTPYDGAGRGWFHYQKDKQFSPGMCTIDLWPDMSEYSQKYETPFLMADGSKACVFSSYDESTIDLHFKWMKEYGIDGIFLQRFVTTLKTESGKIHSEKVLASALKAAQKYGRAISVMYDLSGMEKGDEQILMNDWKFICRKYKVTNRKHYTNYLFHNGKPLVAVWGIGFNDNRKYGFTEIENINTFLKKEVCSIHLGVPAHWREQNDDCLTDSALHQAIMAADIIHPWFVGRYDNDTYNDFKSLIEKDLQWCESHQKDYVPTVFPGFSWYNMKPGNKLNAIPREKGNFFWKQMSNAIKMGCSMLYVAMFDEIDEGTAIFKCAHKVPIGKSKFVAIDKDLPADHYMWLAGQAGLILHGEKDLTTEMPERINITLKNK